MSDIYYGEYVLTPTGNVTHDGKLTYYPIHPSLFAQPVDDPDWVLLDGVLVRYDMTEQRYDYVESEFERIKSELPTL